MKLSKEALIEIIAVVQDGLLGKKDASQGLRELDFEPTVGGELKLSDEYISTHPRSTEAEWDEDDSEPGGAGEGRLN
jgi:hypothetical protein